ncbi:MAG: hypothetical protein AAF740_12270 [Bacteroidota bacterium]
MNYYFSLQFRRFQRWVRENGIHPIMGVLLGISVFVGISILLNKPKRSDN